MARRTSYSILILKVLILLLVALPAAGDEILFEAKDPSGDDTGDGDYVYPTHEAFGQGGQADILSCTISRDEGNFMVQISFRDLVDPWHVGNRLSFVAIAVDTSEGGDDQLRHNAGAYLEDPSEFQIFMAGDTCEILDAQGNKLPTEAICSADNEKNIMILTVPQRDIGAPTESWKYTIAVGLQDDYGAGGLGDFRMVEAQAQEWRGGGGVEELDINPNIYDLILTQETKKVMGLFKGKSKTQEEILGSYNLDKGKYVVLPSAN
jgi:carbohydrate-binding DOMON domain-containing protein